MMDERTMFELLEAYDAYHGLETVQEMLTGTQAGAGYGEGILGNLSYLPDIILRHSPLYHPHEEDGNEKFWDLLEDTKIDNHHKARLLLGMEDNLPGSGGCF